MQIIEQKNPLKRKQKTVPSFLKKTFDLLNDSCNIDYVHWAQSGIGFVITDESSFAKTVLPSYFKHSNYSSFVRQLNMYNFHKIRQNNRQSYFHHEYFDRQNEQALADIKRKPQKKIKKNDLNHDLHSQHEPSLTNIKKQKNVPKYRQIIHKNKISVSILKQISSDKKVQSLKNTQNIFSDERFGQCLPAPACDSSNQFSMEVQQNVKQLQRKLPRLLTRELISASKNTLFPISIQNVATSILSIFN